MGSTGTSLPDAGQPPSKPATDGDRPSISLRTPVHAERLTAFLKEHEDAPAFEVTYTQDESQQSALLCEFELARGSFKRVDLTPSARCLPFEPGEEGFMVPVASLDQVVVAEPAPERYTAAADDHINETRGLRRLAEADPENVPIPKLLPLLEAQDSRVKREALRALELVAGARPGDCRPAIPGLGAMLEAGDRFATRRALRVLRFIGENDSREITHLSAALKPFLRSTDGRTRRDATWCIAAIAGEDQEAVVEATPDLASIIADRTRGLSYAVRALSRISRDYPDRVRPAGTALGEVIGDESLPDGTRLNATAALGPIVEEYPSVGLDVIENVVPLLDSEKHRLRNNAVGLLGATAIVHSDAVQAYTDAIAKALLVEDANTRIHATAALSRIAKDFPDAVAHLTPLLKACLADDDAQVRENACWALGYLRADEAKEQLTRTARSDDVEGVRRTAAWAVNRCSPC